MNFQLTDVEARVLGALTEKEATTPECYPLSLNALINACNQKSNRDPVMSLDEDSARQALRSLTDLGLARSAASDSRVAKYEHRVQEMFNFHRHEAALLCVLLLRGPQTPGELRGRAERLYAFDDLEGVHSALNLLMKRDPPLAKPLARQPGEKEVRFAHLLCGEVELTKTEAVANPTGRPTSGDADRLGRLESTVEALEAELSALRQQFAEFRKLLE